MKLWLDDLRNPVDYGYPNALWCKNLSSFYSLLKFMSDSYIDSIHFDNDLGGDEEGYDAFLYVERELHDGNFTNLKEIHVHSSNPSAVNKFMLAREYFENTLGIKFYRHQY